MTILRPYQAEGCDWIEASWDRLPSIGRRPAVVYQLPTGGGKTPMQAALVERAHARGWTAAIMAPGIDLCRQLRARVGCEVYRTTTLAAHHKAGKPLPAADVWIVDEARCITSAGVSPVVLALQAQGARMAFFDATPETAQGQGLERWADDLRQGPSVKELVTKGHLVPSRVFSAEQGKGLARAPVDVWVDLWWFGEVLKPGTRKAFSSAPLGRKRRALVFAKDKAHARAVVEEFAAKRVPAAFIGDDTEEADRAALLGWTDAHGIFHPGALARGEVLALVCASLLRQGIDIPEIELVVSARAFDSEPLARQAWGRGMRTWPEGGKVDCVMVDLVGGIVDRVGLPDDERVWSLEGEACRAAGEALPACVQCRACLSWGRGGVCRALVPRGGLWVECGFALPPPPPPRVLARDLVEVFADDSSEQRARTLTRFVGEAWLSGLAKGKAGRDLIKAGWSGAYRWSAKYPGMGKPPPRDVARAIRDTGIARLVLLAWGRVVGLCSSEGEDMSRTKSGTLIKQAARPRSDAGSAGYRPLRDGVAPKPIEPKLDGLADFEASFGAGKEAWSTPEGQEFLRTMRGGLDSQGGALVEAPPIEPGSASMQVNGPRPTVKPEPIDPVLAAIVAPIEAEAREIAAPVEAVDPRQLGLFASLGVVV